jgi:hypothetical protein
VLGSQPTLQRQRARAGYVSLSNVRTDEARSMHDVNNAIRHLKLSFEVRNPEDSFQYWVASCRSLGGALLNMSTYSITKDAAKYVRRASEVLRVAAAKISSSEHAHQRAKIQKQLARAVGLTHCRAD